MKVYYNSSLWAEPKGLSGRPQKINWEFESNGLKRIIPTIYHFSKGIVFDLITIINEKEFQDFYEKYKDVEEDLSPIEEQLLEQEHPYKEINIKDIWINDTRVRAGYSSSGIFCTPWNRGAEGRSIRSTYSSILKKTTTFQCSRYEIPYPGTGSKIKNLLRLLHLDKIYEIKFNTYPEIKFYPLDKEFEMALDRGLRKINFIHPITGVKHELYFQNPEPLEIENLYFIQSMYEIDPRLPKGSNLQFDSSIQYNDTQALGEAESAAAAIGIIGGASGPTSAFISGRGKGTLYGKNNLPLYPALSVPSLEKQDRFKFRLEGINIEIDEGEEFYWKEK